jgi:hypothetical protein
VQNEEGLPGWSASLYLDSLCPNQLGKLDIGWNLLEK